MRMITLETRLKEAAALAGITGGITLTGWECSVLCRAINVLRRVAENDCTNPAIEARDALSQL